MKTRELTDLLVLAVGPDPPNAAAFAALTKKARAELLQVATIHGLGPLLYHSLSRLEGDIPQDLLGPLHDLYLHSLLRNRALRDDAATVFQALRNAGVRAIALKGVHLAFAVYPDPALRPMNDIDLLVRPDDVQRATAVLSSLGYGISEALGAQVDYTLMHHTRPVIKPGSVQVEVHHALEQPGSPFLVDQDAIWGRAKPVEGVPGGALAFSPEDLLLHLCTHIAYNHAFDVRLLALRDVREVIGHCEGTDWEVVRSMASTDDGRAPFVRMALAVTERLWPGSVSSDAWPQWARGEAEWQICDTAVEYVSQTSVEVPVAVREIRGSRTVGEQLRALTDSLFPPPSRMREIYRIPESRSVFWAYLWRPVDIIRRRGVRAVGLAAGMESARGELARTESEQRIRQWVRRVAATH